MSEREWKPMRVLIDLTREVDHAFSSLIHDRWRQAWHPNIDIRETAEEYIVEIDLPGVSSDQVEVRVTSNEVTICGIRSATGMSFDAKHIHRERRVGSFCRTIRLPSQIVTTPVETSFRDGVYRLRLRKLFTDAERWGELVP